MADLSCGIAKDVLYMAEGEIMRHARLRRAAEQQAGAGTGGGGDGVSRRVRG